MTDRKKKTPLDRDPYTPAAAPTPNMGAPVLDPGLPEPREVGQPDADWFNRLDKLDRHHVAWLMSKGGPDGMGMSLTQARDTKHPGSHLVEFDEQGRPAPGAGMGRARMLMEREMRDANPRDRFNLLQRIRAALGMGK